MPDTHVEPAGPGPYDRSIESRVSRLEGDMQDVKASLARIEATLPHLATKAELTRVEAGIGRIEAMLQATLPHLATKAELADKPGKAYLWAVLAVLITAYGAGLAALAVLK